MYLGIPPPPPTNHLQNNRIINNFFISFNIRSDIENRPRSPTQNRSILSRSRFLRLRRNNVVENLPPLQIYSPTQINGPPSFLNDTDSTNNSETPTPTNTLITNNTQQDTDEIFESIEEQAGIDQLQFASPNTQQNFFQNVIICPTEEQIRNATISGTITDEMIENGQDFFCTILQQQLEEGDEFMTICACNHTFELNSLTTWFRSNVTCPICRIDIRETIIDIIDDDFSSDESP